MTKKTFWQHVDDLMIRFREYGELITRAVFFCFFLYLRIFIHDLIALVGRWRFLPPDFWPSWVLNFAVLLTGLLLVGGIRDFYLEKKGVTTGKKEKVATIAAVTDAPDKIGEEDQLSVEKATSRELRRVLWIAATVFIYIYTLPIVGYFVATFLLPIAHLLYFKERRVILYVLFPLSAVGSIYILFTQLLAAPLPRGVGIFYDFSALFY